MSRVRRLAAVVAVIWLSSQVVTMMLAPISLVGFGVAGSGADCTCPKGAEANCPMHHKSTPNPKSCVLQSAGHEPTSVLTSLFSVASLVPVSVSLATPTETALFSMSHRSFVLFRPTSPDSPPPRA